MGEPQYTFFIAHTARDKAAAEDLFDRLQPSLRCFLDTRSLVAGAEWDLELPRAQRASRATVVLVSESTESAYYLREEIASAIAYQRAHPGGHRLIPIYLEGIPSNPEMIPYGIRVRHALDCALLGSEGVADELRRIAALLLGEAAASPAPSASVATATRIALYDRLRKLLDTQFDEVMLRVGAPREHLAPIAAPLARRALDLVYWGDAGGPSRIGSIADAIQELASQARPLERPSVWVDAEKAVEFLREEKRRTLRTGGRNLTLGLVFCVGLVLLIDSVVPHAFSFRLLTGMTFLVVPIPLYIRFQREDSCSTVLSLLGTAVTLKDLQAAMSAIDQLPCFSDQKRMLEERLRGVT